MTSVSEMTPSRQLNYLHRMTARIAFILLWIHGGTKVCMFAHDALVSIDSLCYT